MRRALPAIVWLAGAASAHAAPVVHGDLSEARACLPVAGGTLVGTGGGLAFVGDRGEVRRTWTASSGLPGTRIERIVRVGDALWIGTDAGAARVTLGDGALTVAQVVGGSGVRDLVRHGNRTYVATWGDGVHVLGGSAVRYRVASIPTQRLNITALAVHDGALHAATGAGLYRLNGGALEAIVDDVLPKRAAVAALHTDGARLYIGTASGLYVREAGSTQLVGPGDIRHIDRGDDGSILVARLGEGLARVDRGRLVTLLDLPRELATAQTFAFGSGGAACAGGIDGLLVRAGARWTKLVRPSGPPSNDISAIAVDGDRLWVGTFDRGLAVRERGVWRTIAVDARINALHVSAGRAWVATASGLYSVVPRAGRDEVSRLARGDGLPSRGVLALAKLRDGRMLVGTSAGAVIVGSGRPVRLAKGQDLGNVWAVAEDPTGALWLGTTTGLYRGSETASTWQRFAVATQHLRDDWVTALALARDGRALFVGTYHGGVTRLELATADAIQLGDGWINPGGLAVDGERLLASTMDGLQIGDGKTVTWATQAGLPGKDVTMAARAGTTLYVATRRGLAELR